MKKMILSLVMSLGALLPVNAMSYEQAREEARFLTDKMAYELNLNDQQYNDAYEINLDYLLSVRDESDLYGDYLTYRNADLRHILYDWQYSLFMAADYFFRPLTWLSGAWYLPVYRYYRVGHYYYNHPSVFYSYRGGHGRYYHHAGFYVSRRPHWSGGFRGHDRGPIGHHGSVHHGGNHPSHRPGGSYHSPNRGGGSHMSGRPSNHDSRSHGSSSYGHPSSTRSTAGHSSHTSVGHSSAGRSSVGHSSTSHSSVGHSSSSSYGGSRPSSFGGGSHTRSGSFSGGSHSGGSRGGSFGGGSHGGSSHGGSSRGGGRGR